MRTSSSVPACTIDHGLARFKEVWPCIPSINVSQIPPPPSMPHIFSVPLHSYVVVGYSMRSMRSMRSSFPASCPGDAVLRTLGVRPDSP